MNYIKHLTGFYERISDDDRLSSTHVSLYLALFQFWNANRFDNPVSISRGEVMKLSKIGSYRTYYKCMHELDAFGYLKYKPSHNPLKGSQVHMYNFDTTVVQAVHHTYGKSGTSSVQVVNHSSIKSGTSRVQVVHPSLNNIKHINSKTFKTKNKGNQLFSSHFRIHPKDYPLIFKLLVWIVKDKVNAKKQGLHLHKGIMLTGPVGCGKTSFMKLTKFFLPRENRHIIKSCRDVSFEFIQDGYEVISRYSKQSFHYHRPRTYCFDDLGTENSLKYYGNDCNVMAEVLLSRYDLFITQRLITHLTTNLNSSEIEQMYGPRVRSRMREMFNLISFSNESGDKRL